MPYYKHESIFHVIQQFMFIDFYMIYAKKKKKNRNIWLKGMKLSLNWKSNPSHVFFWKSNPFLT